MIHFSNEPWSKKITLTFYACLVSFSLMGIRFESPLPNYIIIGILLTIPFYLIYILYFCFKPHSTIQKTFKILSLTLVAVAAFICTLFLLFQLLAIAFLISDGNVDMSKIEIGKVSLNEYTNVVAYQTNGGATTDFGTTIYKERRIFAGLKIVNRIVGIDHTDDIILEKVEGKVIIKDINFTDSTYEQEYYTQGGNLYDGIVLEI